MKFIYEAYDLNGKLTKGELDVPDENVAIRELSARGLIPVRIKTSELLKKEERKGFFSLKTKGKIKDKDISVFCRQLGFLVSVGISIVDSLNIVAEQTPNETLKNILKAVAKEISEGQSFSKAASKYRNAFPSLLLSLIKVGEETGLLDQNLQKASKYYENIAKIKGKIKSASFYPTFVFIIATVITTGIIYFLVPIFAQIYAGFGHALPGPTQTLLDVSNFLHSHILFFIGFLILGVSAFSISYKNSYKFRKSVHIFLMRAPVIGPIFHKAQMASFARTTSSLFSAGVALDRALELIEDITDNLVFKEATAYAKDKLREGKPFWQTIRDTKVFSPMFVSMVKIGEDTGRLDELLNTLADFYEDEVDKAVDAMISLIEPLMIVVIGGIIGMILIALYMPIFKIGSLIKA